MANAHNFWGLRPIRHFNGAPWNGQTLRCYISEAEANAMYLGDPVKLTTLIADIHSDGKSMGITVAGLTTGSHIFGVITSFETTKTCSTVYRAALTERYCQVCLANDIVFRIRGDGQGTPAKTWQGLNADMVAGTDSTFTGLSGDGLDETTPTYDQALPLVILHVSDVEDNELAIYCQWDVIINIPQLLANVAGRYLGIVSTGT